MSLDRKESISERGIEQRGRRGSMVEESSAASARPLGRERGGRERESGSVQPSLDVM